MKIYKHEFNNGVIKTREAEAVEKPKSYYIKSRDVWETRVLKDEIERLDVRGVYPKMFTLTPDKTIFIKELINFFERGKEQAVKALQKYDKKLSFLRDVAEEIKRGTEGNESGGM